MFGEVTFAVLGVLFLIYDVRTFASTFQQTFYGQANTTLALLAGGVFATSLLAPIVGWRLGPRRSVGLGAAMLGIATLLATLSRNNISDLVLTVVGLAGGFWWLALFHAARPADRPSPFPVAVPIAIVLDLALRAAFRTIPVVDQPLTVAAPLVLVAALVFLAAGLISIGWCSRPAWSSREHRSRARPRSPPARPSWPASRSVSGGSFSSQRPSASTRSGRTRPRSGRRRRSSSSRHCLPAAGACRRGAFCRSRSSRSSWSFRSSRSRPPGPQRRPRIP